MLGRVLSPVHLIWYNPFRSLIFLSLDILAKKNKKKKETEVTERTPIVAVMGHVDHGKTTLLDSIRDTSVVDTEAGGITQNTRAHQVVHNKKKITFIDTPGHEAFSEMRSRGAVVTDIVVLVVAADDGVQPQTKESIEFALREKVPVIVAINKIDVPGKKLEKLKQELTSAGLAIEEYGGDVMVVEVSALKKTNLDELLDRVLLLAELSELKTEEAEENTVGHAYVLVSSLDKNLGPVSLMLMQSGKVTKKDRAVFGGDDHKVRAIWDEHRLELKEAHQGDPIWVIGLKEVLPTGQIIKFVKDPKQAKAYFKTEEQKQIEEEQAQVEEEGIAELNMDDDDILSQLLDSAKREDEIKYLNIVLRADTSGTLEVVEQQLESLASDDVKIKVIDSSTGSINEKDVIRAKAASGIVIGFQVEPSRKIVEIAKKERVLVRNFGVIYDLIDELGEVLDSMEEPITEDVEISRAKVKQVFKLSNGNHVAGCEVKKGNVLKGYKAFVERDGERIHDGRIIELRKLKKEVKEVKKGEECGIKLSPDFEIVEGDEVVCYKVETY